MKTTRKQVEYRNGRVIEVGYCNLDHTLNECADRRDGHTEGIYGWNADIYEFGNFAICTGYRPFGKYTLPYKFEKKWEEKAKAHYQKCYTRKNGGKGDYPTPEEVGLMRYKFRCAFAKAVEKELEKQTKKKKAA